MNCLCLAFLMNVQSANAQTVDNDADGYYSDVAFGDPQYDPDDTCNQIPIGAGFCPSNSGDTDGDGVPDDCDYCPNSSSSSFVNSQGCTDSDYDGYYSDAIPTSTIYDPDDSCSQVPSSASVCDSDYDGVPDNVDQCPFGYEYNPTANGCYDNDGDGYYPGLPNDNPSYDPDDLCNEIPGGTGSCPDSDGDGVYDPNDSCPFSASGAYVNSNGCTDGDYDGYYPDVPFSDPQYDPDDTCNQIPNGTNICLPADSDNDNVPDSSDACPNTVSGAIVNSSGCTDNDSDGFYPDVPSTAVNYDPDDTCNQIPNGTQSCSTGDSDNDNVPDGSDLCPNSLAGASVNSSGCTDNDADGFYPDVPSTALNYDPDDTCNQIPVGTQSCSTGGGDSDGDNVPDTSDVCPNSAAGANVNAQGCTDDDADGYYPDIPSSSPFYDTDDTCNQIPNGTGVCATVATCLTLPGITDAPQVNAIPTGYTDAGCAFPPSIIAGNGLFPGSTTSTISNVDGTPSLGGNMALLVDPVNAGCTSGSGAPGIAGGLSTSLTGLTVGQTYSISVEWQQASVDADIAGGTLSISVDGLTETTYTSSGGLSDGWQIATYTFTAANTSHTATFGILSTFANGYIVVSAGTLCDEDSDGVPSSTDNCPNTLVGATVDANGCTDGDADGYYPDAPTGSSSYDSDDTCNQIPNGTGSCTGGGDTDNDNVPDTSDVCPNSAAGANVNASGCTDDDADGYYPDIPSSSPFYDTDDTCNQIPNGTGTCVPGDADNDNVPDISDACPFSAAGATVDANGCTDGDADGYYPDAPPSDPSYDLDDTCDQIPSGTGSCNACASDNGTSTFGD